MKNFIIILFTITQVQLYAGEPNKVSASFENFVSLFCEATHQQQSELLRPFFSETIDWQHADGSIDHLEFDDLIVKLSEVGDPNALLRSLAKGFVFTGDEQEARFTALHNDLRHGKTIEIKVSALRLRRFPSTTAPVVCLLENGITSGTIDLDRPEVNDTTGICWIPLLIQHSELGSIKGYVSAEYIETRDLELPAGMNIVHESTGWKISGFTYL